MRFLAVLLVAVVSCQSAFGQPTTKELITKFRTTVGATAATAKSLPYLIQYRGNQFLYSLRDGKLIGESLEFQAKLYGYTDKRHLLRKEMEMKIGIVPFKVIEAIDGDTGWYQLNEGEGVSMSKVAVDARKQRELHVEVFLGKEPFDDTRWQFSEPKETVVREHDSWVFEAKTKGIHPLTLYFDKQTGLMLRLTGETTDFSWLPGGGKPKLESFTRDLYFREWKKFGPRMLPGYLEIYQDGVLWQFFEPTSLALLPSADSKLFVAPQPKK